MTVSHNYHPFSFACCVRMAIPITNALVALSSLCTRIEYNPKLSEATPTTRVAYVKFMAHAMRRESNAEKLDQENTDADKSKTETSDDKKIQKSILRTSSKASAVRYSVFISFLAFA